MRVEYYALELDVTADGASIQQVLVELTNQRTVPNVFVNGTHIGGCDSTYQAYHDGSLQKLLGDSKDAEPYDYDLIIIGGGSGGLACSKEAATLGKKVMVLDYVVPTPLGTSWGLGGTCVNVGCIPKKLMHQAALLGQALQDSRKYGWQYEEQVKHNWEIMVEAIQNYIGSLNWGYRVSLREKSVTYLNSYGEFIEPHKIKATNRKGQVTYHTAETFVLATGERPRYLGIPGDKEYCITSDDLFSLPYCPGKTLVVGASYVALECAGFLAGLGLDVTVMVRSILLRGFDQEMAEKVGAYMETHGVKFIRKFVPIQVEQLEEGMPGRLKVTAKSTEGPEIFEEEYNTVLIAIGRDACTRNIGLETIGVNINEKNGKVPVNDEEQTNVPYVYAIGDILDGKLELTPVAIQAGRLLARRLYGGSSTKCDYINVPTTVFTPLEYGSCGLAEERAIEEYGKQNLEVYHTLFWPLEWTVPGRDNNTCYAKIICNKHDNNRVIGFHVLGPNAGEVTQGFAAAIKCGLTKELLDETIGIHPTCAEVFTTMDITKASGQDITQRGC
ncbi:PREDICTED: thioredoxin reductase 1, cytoplasmic-like [Tauraco erythrolophus]|uniref:thioredoxin reductase 1, cytoplasmic-like n=1 Tax=Tauraco erythrolophus TaxID=121530 RepID=UPI0005239075|nr:PREDICTED: thioredoxin reductase 1, cytoplasmic-like [Tauraco erythrolophus]